MDVQELVDGVRDTLTVRRVFGDAVEKNGVTAIPVARVQGGAGGGQGDSPDGKGWGGGGGLAAHPAGMFVIVGDRVRWEPALDINRIVAGVQIVVVVALLTVRGIVKARLKAESARGGG